MACQKMQKGDARVAETLEESGVTLRNAIALEEFTWENRTYSVDG